MAISWSDALYLGVPLLGILISVSLIVLVLQKNFMRAVNRIFALVLVSLCLWNVLLFAMRASPDTEQALFWGNLALPAGIALPIFYYHFTVVYSGVGSRKLIWAAYSFLVVAYVLSVSGLAISHISVSDYGYAAHFLPAMYFIALGGVFFLVNGLVNLIKACKHADRREDITRYNYMIFAIAFPFVGGLVDLFPNHPPLSLSGNILFCLITGIAIIRVQLFDIRINLRKVLPYVLVSSLVALVYIGLIALFNRIVGEGDFPGWVHVVLIALLAVVFNPTWQKAQEVINRLFHRRRYDFLEELERVSVETYGIRDLKELGAEFVRLMSEVLQTPNVHFLLSEPFQYSSVAAVGDTNLEFKISSWSPIIRWLQSNSGLLYYQDIDIIQPPCMIPVYQREELQSIDAELIVPLKAKSGDLVGLLILGKKHSGQSYSHEDEQLISAVAGRIGIEIENARLYEAAEQSEKALRESERLFSTIVEAAPSLLMIVDGEGINRYLSLNCVNFTGYTREELMGKETFWIHSGDRRRISKTFRRAFSEGFEGGGFEYRAVKKSGEVWYASSSWKLLKDDNNENKAIVLQTIDVTEMKKEEVEKKELAEKAQLASRLAAVGEMASGIAHEINNPLTGVIGFCEIVKNERITANVRKKIDIIHDGAQRVAGIVNRLLTFARRQKQAKTLVDINQIIKATLQLRSYEMKTSNIEVITRLAPMLPWTMADAVQIQQVMLNIILNAETEMKLAHGRGTLFITTQTDGNDIRVSLKDDGPGIKEEDLHRIFDPFFTTREVGQGTGLGLSVCHGIIAEHGGKIKVESQFGSGATFTVELPVVTEAGPAETEAAFDSPDYEPELSRAVEILVVDDELAILELMKVVLGNEGYSVTTADKASIALEMIDKRRFDLALIDIKLPGISGIELYDEIKKMAPTNIQNVAFITGDVMGADTAEFLNREQVPCFVKPLNISELIQGVRHILTDTQGDFNQHMSY